MCLGAILSTFIKPIYAMSFILAGETHVPAITYAFANRQPPITSLPSGYKTQTPIIESVDTVSSIFNFQFFPMQANF